MSSAHLGSTPSVAPTPRESLRAPVTLGNGVVSGLPRPCRSPVLASCAASSNAPAALLTQDLCTDRSLHPEHPPIGHLYGSFWSLLDITPRQIPFLDIIASTLTPCWMSRRLSTLKYSILNTKNAVYEMLNAALVQHYSPRPGVRVDSLRAMALSASFTAVFSLPRTMQDNASTPEPFSSPAGVR